jgi:hypothetical protein
MAKSAASSRLKPKILENISLGDVGHLKSPATKVVATPFFAGSEPVTAALGTH